MTTRVCKTFSFDAAHHLPKHDGKCRRPHGHTYTVQVVCIGPVIDSGPKQGMVVDFGDVKDAYTDRIHSRVDHQDLNVVLYGHVDPTTAENIAHWILGEMRSALGLDVVESVRVYETPTCYAEAS